METTPTIENEIKFIMNTDWLFQEPIDFEHKKYTLLGYFKKIDELINQNKIYPIFIELSIHLASIQTIIKENVILYTNKTFKSVDDEVLLKELLAKNIPTLDEKDSKEIEKIIKFSATKFFEYFSIVKSYWSLVYETISISIKRNKKYLRSNCGYMTYHHKKNNHVYVWEYLIDKEDNSSDNITNIKLIYEDNKKDLTLNQVIENFSGFSDKEKKYSPVFELKSDDDYPVQETLLPLFKRKIISYIFQSIRIEDIKKFD